MAASPIRRQVPVQDYLRLQARYGHLFRPQERTEVIARIQAAADRNIARFGLLDNRKTKTDRTERVQVTQDTRHDSTGGQ
ncbi:MAG TPA: hypothetical protein VMI73_20820 [Trebonia sp.]|nr:hypothetical protein [Trebonia sp.]